MISTGGEPLPDTQRERTEDEPSISIIVPVYNGGPRFKQCLDHLVKAVPAPREILVVADGDTDDSWLVAERFGARVIRLADRGGPARARNAGARESVGDVLFFVDADVAVHPDAVEQVASAFRNEPELAAVFGSYDDAPAEPNFLSQYKNLLHHYVHQAGREETFTFWAGCGAIRKKTFLEMGGFDERYREPSVEDIDLGYRLKRAGQRIRLHKTLQGTHLKRWDARSLLRSDFFHRALPWTELILEQGTPPGDLNLKVSGRLSVVSSYGLLASLLCAAWRPETLWVGAAFLLAILALNAPLYLFFARKRGASFALKSIPWHIFYFLYGGAAFAIGAIRTRRRRSRSAGSDES